MSYSHEGNHAKDKCLLGFDLSTTVLGYCVMSIETGELLELDYFCFSDKTALLDKAKELDAKIDELTAIYNIKIFCIEERLKSFRAGGTNAEAMGKLTAFNFYCQTVFHKQNILIKEIPSATARKLAIPGFHSIARKIKDAKQKEIAFNFIVKELGEDKFPKKIMKSGPRKGQEVYVDEAMDMSDAYVIGKAGMIIMKDKI